MSTISECSLCTVPTEPGVDVCRFCATYQGGPVDSSIPDSPPESKLSRARRLALDAIPADAPILTVADVVTARAHLHAAVRLLDRAAGLVR